MEYFLGSNLEDFHGLLERTRREKLEAVSRAAEIKKQLPKGSAQLNGDMKYYKDMEYYEIRSRDVLKTRIKKILMVKIYNVIFRGTKRSPSWC